MNAKVFFLPCLLVVSACLSAAGSTVFRYTNPITRDCSSPMTCSTGGITRG